jgi:hypothetical protein
MCQACQTSTQLPTDCLSSSWMTQAAVVNAFINTTECLAALTLTSCGPSCYEQPGFNCFCCTWGVLQSAKLSVVVG